MKRINCNEAIERFGTIPNTERIENQFPQYTKGWAFICGDDWAVGFSETEESATEACTMINKMFGIKTFFLFSAYGHFKADWTFCGALIAE